MSVPARGAEGEAEETERLGSAGGQLKDSSLSCRAHPRLDCFGEGHAGHAEIGIELH